jgi:hypothetical protein
MNGKEHLLMSLFFGTIFLKIAGVFSFTALIWLYAANAFDIDHIFRYWYDKYRHNFTGLKKHLDMHYAMKKQRFLVFHTFEFLIVLGLLSYFSPVFYYIFLGWMIHMMGDLFLYFRHHRKVTKFFPWMMTWHIINTIKLQPTAHDEDWYSLMEKHRQ